MRLCFGAACLLAVPASAQDVAIIEGLPGFSVSRSNGATLAIRRSATPAPQAEALRRGASMACPPFCIQPMQAAPGVATVAELELLDFLAGPFKDGRGVLVDARLREWYDAGTIPGAVSMPYPALDAANSFLPDILRALGARQTAGGWNFDTAFDLMVFCNGAWSDMAPRAIEGLIAAGYPAAKLRYYRGGMSAWTALGLSVEEPAG